MSAPGRFWSVNIALSMAIVFAAGGLVTLNSSRDDAMILPLLAFPMIGAGAISHAITNKTLIFWPSKLNTYKWTAFERWSAGIGMAVFISFFLVDVFIKHGK